ncbi:hypothetical protein B0J13DRAFT_521609 [Dactylonectria estremocensis]|uniref:Uncharacterized protein n=1 Tax=Dactylonectria estremocensis TaxID=1079267 RepID=A0A9P9F745_9HYPO|nr:hypothetical protein B0J13DRAFT_521609 [Dactylonectria estremocensis]
MTVRLHDWPSLQAPLYQKVFVNRTTTKRDAPYEEQSQSSCKSRQVMPTEHFFREQSMGEAHMVVEGGLFHSLAHASAPSIKLRMPSPRDDGRRGSLGCDGDISASWPPLFPLLPLDGSSSFLSPIVSTPGDSAPRCTPFVPCGENEKMIAHNVGRGKNINGKKIHFMPGVAGCVSKAGFLVLKIKSRDDDGRKLRNHQGEGPAKV